MSKNVSESVKVYFAVFYALSVSVLFSKWAFFLWFLSVSHTSIQAIQTGCQPPLAFLLSPSSSFFCANDMWQIYTFNHTDRPWGLSSRNYNQTHEALKAPQQRDSWVYSVIETFFFLRSVEPSKYRCYITKKNQFKTFWNLFQPSWWKEELDGIVSYSTGWRRIDFK